jgi:hypothetical protein
VDGIISDLPTTLSGVLDRSGMAWSGRTDLASGR